MSSENTRTIYENYLWNGDLKSLVILTDKKSKKYLMPKWAVVLSSLACCFILISLGAALFAVYYAQRPALYLENCEKRSCIKGFNLKCINNTCLCDTGYIYIDKCSLKKDYTEKCHKTSYCKDNKNMICKNGVCECDSVNYWNGSMCASKSTYQQPCSVDKVCFTGQMLYCDTITKTCLCDNFTRYIRF